MKGLTPKQRRERRLIIWGIVKSRLLDMGTYLSCTAGVLVVKTGLLDETFSAPSMVKIAASFVTAWTVVYIAERHGDLLNKRKAWKRRMSNAAFVGLASPAIIERGQDALELAAKMLGYLK